MDTISDMLTIKETNYFSKWFKKLKDTRGKITIIRRIERIKQGNFGDYKMVGSGVYELKIPTGPGYRVYYSILNGDIVLLLFAGDKSTQNDDIKKAKNILHEIKNG